MASDRTQQTERLPAQALIEKAAQFYHGTLQEDEDAHARLRNTGLAATEFTEAFTLGYCTGELTAILPPEVTDDRIHTELKALGILNADGSETLHGCITTPILDPDSGPVGLAGFNPDTRNEHVAGTKSPHAWNLPAATNHADLVAATTLADGLALAAAGIPNTIAFIGKPHARDLRTLKDLGVNSLSFTEPPVDPDKLKGIQCFTLELEHTPSAMLASCGPEALAEAMDAAERTPIAQDTPPVTIPVADGFKCAFASRRYELRGIERSSRRLRAAVRAERQARLHVDTVDLYSARARRNLSLDLCRFFEEAKEVIDADIDRLIRLAERWLEERPEPESNAPIELSDKEIAEAHDLGTAPDLLEQILTDYAICGLVGEESNKLLTYLAAVSRKMPEPLSVLILSSSGAGKSALQDATLKLCPPEDLVKLTSMTGRALFYKGRKSLKHKILALEEEAGAEGAAYPLRALISSGELIIETTVKDLGSGQLTTVQNRVEGPCAVFITTTSPDTDPETRSRFFVTSVDESRAQTRRILDFQRKRRTLQGRSVRTEMDKVTKRHRNFQRLLKPLAVVNPFAEELAYGDDRLQSRRDQPKLLNLIAAVAFLRQMTKPVKTLNGEPYIEVDAEDMGIAHELAGRVLRRHLDDLNPVSFELLGEIQRLVEARVEAATVPDAPTPDPRDVTFTRRELREFSGWPHIRVRRYLVELIEMEFIAVVSGRKGSAYRYGLLEQPGQPGQGWSLHGHPSQSS